MAVTIVTALNYVRIETREDLISLLSQAGVPSSPDVRVMGLRVSDLFNQIMSGAVSITLVIQSRYYTVLSVAKVTRVPTKV